MEFKPNERAELVRELTTRNPRRPLALVLACGCHESDLDGERPAHYFATGIQPFYTLVGLLALIGSFRQKVIAPIGDPQKERMEAVFVGTPADLSSIVHEWEKAVSRPELGSELFLKHLKLAHPTEDVLRSSEFGQRITVFDPSSARADETIEKWRPCLHKLFDTSSTTRSCP
jgi:hypothetical protein